MHALRMATAEVERAVRALRGLRDAEAWQASADGHAQNASDTGGRGDAAAVFGACGVIRAADLFCGAGGASTGLLRACRALEVDVELLAVNHWPVAVQTHRLNHPHVKHLCEAVERIDPRDAVPGGRLHLLLAGPECTHFSTARGGRPVNPQSRASAWHIIKWAQELYIDTILIENVPEFRTWGPVGVNGKPLKAKKGETYRAFFEVLRSLGYRVEDRILNAADYGDPTTRQRLFIIARRGRHQVRWPAPTHSKSGVASLFGTTKPWKPARDIIDCAIIGDAVKEAESNDPRALKKQIVTLTQQLAASSKAIATRPKANASATPPPAPKIIEKPVLKDAQITRLEKLVADCDRLSSKFDNLSDKLVTVAAEVRADVKRAVAPPATAVPRVHPSQRVAPSPPRKAVNDSFTNRSTALARASTPISSNGDLSGPERKILASLAELEALGLHPADKVQLGLMAGYTNVRSGGFSEPLGRLVAGGYAASPTTGKVAITDVGRDSVGPVAPPQSSDEMQARVMDKLTGPERKLLDVLIDVYPLQMTKDQLAAACDPPYTNIRSGGFSEPLGRLVTLRLVHNPARGVVSASPALFLEG